MSNVQQARETLDRGQGLLDQVEADNKRIVEFLDWISGAEERSETLADFIAGEGADALDVILAAEPQAVTPPVANEDSAWGALAERYDLTIRLLQHVADTLRDTQGSCEI